MEIYDDTQEYYDEADEAKGYDTLEKLNNIDNVYDDDSAFSAEPLPCMKSLDELAEMLSDGDEDTKNDVVWELNEFVENKEGGIGKLFKIIEETLDNNYIDYDEEYLDCAKAEALEEADGYDDYSKFIEIAVDTLTGNNVIA